MDKLNLKSWGLDIQAANARQPKPGDTWEHPGPRELTGEDTLNFERIDPEPMRSGWVWTQKIAASLAEGRVIHRQFVVGVVPATPTGNVIVQEFDLEAGVRRLRVERE